MTGIAAEDRLDFRFERYRPAVTFDAHRLLHLAREHGVQAALNEHLMRAHFGEGELLSDHVTLRRLALEAGLSDAQVIETLASDWYADLVREDERVADRHGVSAVPFFLVDGALGVSGALFVASSAATRMRWRCSAARRYAANCAKRWASVCCAISCSAGYSI